MTTELKPKNCQNCGMTISKGISCASCDAVKYCLWHVEETFEDPQARLEFCQKMRAQNMTNWRDMKKEGEKSDSHLMRVLYKFFRRVIYPLPYFAQDSILGRVWAECALRAEMETEARQNRDDAQRMAYEAIQAATRNAMSQTETHRDRYATEPIRAYEGFDFAESRP